MRQDGMSYRQIAEADGTVHETAVVRTVADAIVDMPATVTGKDGKRYKATVQRAVDSTVSNETTETPAIASFEAVKPPPTVTGKDGKRRKAKKPDELQ
jgi:hypothetical protein